MLLNNHTYYSLKYGTLPIVRSTGGLIDTVNSLTANHSNIKSATGLAFKEPNVHDCLEAIQKAVKLWYQHPDKYKIIQQNAMKQDFSWEKPAEAYLKLYKQLINS